MADDFLYWSQQSQRAAVLAINAPDALSEASHRSQMLFSIRKALVALDPASVLENAQAEQPLRP